MTDTCIPEKVKEFLKTHRFQICIIGRFNDCESIMKRIEDKKDLLFSFICLEDDDWQTQIQRLYAINLIIIADKHYCDEIMLSIDGNAQLRGVPVIGYNIPFSEAERAMMSFNLDWELNAYVWPYCMASLTRWEAIDKLSFDEKQTIICIDNCEDNILIIDTLVDNDNIEVLGCSSNQEALDILEKRDIAVVVSDKEHIGEDANALIEAMRQDPRYALIPFVICSACMYNNDRYSFTWKQFSKPIKASRVRHTIKQFVTLSRYLKMLS